MISRRMMMNDKIVTQSGKQLVLEKCKGSYFNGFSMYGKSTQVKTTGVNIANGMDNVYKKEQSEQQKQNYCWGYSLGGGPLILDKPLKAGTYTFSFYSDAIASIYLAKAPYVTGQFVQYSVNQKVTGDIKNGLQRYFCLFQLTDERDLIGIYSDGYTTCFGGMINFGDKPLPYEPYTGGKPSPSAEYPQKIVSAGERGSITAEVTGRNLLKPNSYNTYYEFPLKANTVMTLMTNGKPSQGGNIKFIATDGSDVWFSIDKGQTRVCRSIGNKDVKGFYNLLDMSAGLEYMFAVGNIKTYTPYVDPQSLTLATPNGLPGIPVATGGNYVDETGQQWICDEVDLGRGKYIQRIKKIILDGSEPWEMRINDNTKRTFFVIHIKESMKDTGILCSHFRWKAFGYDSEGGNDTVSFMSDWKSFVISTNRFSDVEQLKQFLSKNNTTVYYILETPVETPLSPEQIAAYKKLHTYYGTIHISNTESVDMKVVYRKVRE